MSPINVQDDMPQMKQIALKKTYIFKNTNLTLIGNRILIHSGGNIILWENGVSIIWNVL